MMGKFLSELFTDTAMISIALFIFLGTFGALFAWVFFRRGSREFYEKIAMQPLGDNHESR